MIKTTVKLAKAALTARKAVVAVTKPAATIRDMIREQAVKMLIPIIVAAATKFVAKEKVDSILGWEKEFSFSFPAEAKWIQWLRDKETHSTLVDLINQGLQVPLALYGVTPAQVSIVEEDTGMLKVSVSLKVHKNSELK